MTYNVFGGMLNLALSIYPSAKLQPSSSQQQTMNHVVNIYLLTKFGGGLQSLYYVDDDALSWLELVKLK